MLYFSGKFVVYKTRIPPIDVAGRHKTPSVRVNLKREYSSSFIQKRGSRLPHFGGGGYGNNRDWEE
jgi:hypothetical protein